MLGDLLDEDTLGDLLALFTLGDLPELVIFGDFPEFGDLVTPDVLGDLFTLEELPLARMLLLEWAFCVMCLCPLTVLPLPVLDF